MPSQTPPCRPHLIASGPIARVESCPTCDIVSIHLGALTVRLDPAACESLWATLSEALTALHRERCAEAAIAARQPMTRGVA
jgi:hypothetical protein